MPAILTIHQNTTSPGYKALNEFVRDDYLVQEIRSPRPGSFVFRARLRAEASSPEFFRDVFGKNFRCRLVLVQFTAPTKLVNESREMASVDFEPQLVASGSNEWQTVELSKGFLAPPPGARVLNFGAAWAFRSRLCDRLTDP